MASLKEKLKEGKESWSEEKIEMKGRKETGEVTETGIIKEKNICSNKRKEHRRL